MSETKICKYCKTEIPKDAKICPNCRKKQKGKLGIIIAVVVVLLIIGAAAGGGDDDKNSSSTNTAKTESTSNKDSSTTKTEEAAEPEPEPEIEYISVSKQELSDALNANALKAADTYKGKYLEVSGYLDVIDSSGKYISINAGGDDYTFVSVRCDIKNDEQKAIIMDLNTGDALTIKGKCTDVGEILGYDIDIEEIIVN